jgi:MFS family permease
MFLFMTFYFQNVDGYSAVKSGLLFLPFSVGVIFSAGVASQLLPRIGPRPLATIGCLMGSVGLSYLSFVRPDSPYLTHVMPPMIITSLGLGLAFVTLASTALFNVEPRDTGAASAVLSTAQQLGGSFGTAIQNTIFVSSATAFAANALPRPTTPAAKLLLHNTANVHGFDEAFRFGSLMLLVAAVAFYFIVNIDRHHLGQHDEVTVASA